MSEQQSACQREEQSVRRGSFKRVWPSSILLVIVVAVLLANHVHAFGVSSTRFFMKSPKENKPKLILIGGCPGTGKSTFGMSVALDQGILKCISTDTVRAVMRSFVAEAFSPALHRSSYGQAFEGEDDPVRSWKETCSVLSGSVEGLIDDAIARKTSIVVEGVHVIPSRHLIEKWEDNGGTAVGCILQIQDEDKHKLQLHRRGVTTGAYENEQAKLEAFDRIRKIQDELIRLAQESNWLRIEQRIGPDPLDIVDAHLRDNRPTPSAPHHQEPQKAAEDASPPLLGVESSPTPTAAASSSRDVEGEHDNPSTGHDVSAYFVNKNTDGDHHPHHQENQQPVSHAAK